MNIAERIMMVLRGGTPDRLPVGIYSRYHRSGGVERAARNLGLGILDFEPPVSLMAPPWHLHAGYVSEVKGAEFEIKLTWEHGEQVEWRSYRTPVGSISQRIIRDPSYGSDWISAHYIKGLQDYRVMKYIVENTVFFSRPGAIEQKVKDLGGDGIVLGRVDRLPFQKLLIELAGPERLFIDLAEDPGPVEELLEAMNARQEEQFAMALQSPAEVIWQPDNVTADMTHPRYFNKYLAPHYRRFGEVCRAAGKVYAVHMDGKLSALRQPIAEMPVDVIESFSLAEVGGDIAIPDAVAAWPGKVLCPNFPSSLSGKTSGEIEEYVHGVINAFAGHPFMLQVSEDIPLDSYERVLPALCRAVMNNKV
jgi:uroporphyrinogen-III decarboxylase